MNDIHNKDYSVVKTFRVGGNSRPFLMPTSSLITSRPLKKMHETVETLSSQLSHFSHFSHANFCIALFALSALSPSIVQKVQKVQSDFLHGDIDDIASIATFASAFFHLLGTFFLLFFTTQLPSKR